jgi:putative transposase
MPRRPRSYLPDGLYHITGRAIFESPLFEDNDDRHVFLYLLRSVIREFEVDCLAYCLIGTHYHLLLQCRRENLSEAMHRLNGRYARHFNDRHLKTGHVFGDRFSAYVIRDDRHLQRACAYIAANPVKAGLCKTADEWPWTWISTATALPAGEFPTRRRRP